MEMTNKFRVTLEFTCQSCKYPTKFSDQQLFKKHLGLHKPKQKYGHNVVDIVQIRKEEKQKIQCENELKNNLELLRKYELKLKKRLDKIQKIKKSIKKRLIINKSM